MTQKSIIASHNLYSISDTFGRVPSAWATSQAVFCYFNVRQLPHHFFEHKVHSVLSIFLFAPQLEQRLSLMNRLLVKQIFKANFSFRLWSGRSAIKEENGTAQLYHMQFSVLAASPSSPLFGMVQKKNEICIFQFPAFTIFISFVLSSARHFIVFFSRYTFHMQACDVPEKGFSLHGKVGFATGEM